MIKKTPNGSDKHKLRSFLEDNEDYERWLHRQCDVVEKDLAHKHERMQKDEFTFLRATFFRWAKCIETLCHKLKDAPAVLSVGDIHVENYGTWRDAEGRLVWGINDFDEAAFIPYPFDLVRLATSVRLAKTGLDNGLVAALLLEGYRKGLAEPAPSLLDEQESWMRPYVACSDEERRDFWHEVKHYQEEKKPPPEAASALKSKLPKGAKLERFASLRKGGGSLGRPRYVAIASWAGGLVVREAKAMVPSAWHWAHGEKGKSRLLKVAKGEFRAFDPHLDVIHHYVVRRIAPDQRKIDLGQTGMRLRLDLLRAMGFDLGAVHAATPDAREAIESDLDKQKKDWLHSAAKTAAKAVKNDFEEWKKVKLPS